MKVFVLPPKENWVVDRLVAEWKAGNPDITVEDPREADVIWLLADWCWNHLPVPLLQQKKVVATMWHLVPEKFNLSAQREFLFRDQLIDLYHAPSLKSAEQIREIGKTSKPIWHQIPWVNQELWHPLDRDELREKHGISKVAYLVGSFQRDTEGYDLKSPKLEKGPDRFCDLVTDMHRKDPNVEVLLGGWRRQYVMRRLDYVGIKYHYIEKAPESVLNEMYNMLDLYIVASRYEGGPQAVVECAASETPVISTDVGLASEILRPESIFTMDTFEGAEYDLDYAYDAVKKLFIPEGFAPFRSRFERLVEEV